MCKNEGGWGDRLRRRVPDTAGSSQATTLSGCASDPSKVFLPASGQQLIDDFQEIAQTINRKRLSK